jgi:hypothetical protein
MTNTHEAFLDLIDFVEDHGGALSGEQRDKLVPVVTDYKWLQPDNSGAYDHGDYSGCLPLREG